MQSTPSGEIPAYATFSGKSGAVVMTGRLIDKPTSVTVRMEGSKQKFNSCHVWRIMGNEFEYQIKEEDLPVEAEDVVTIKIAPQEVVVAEFR